MVPARVEVGVARDAERHVQAGLREGNEMRLDRAARPGALGQELRQAPAQGGPDLGARSHEPVPGRIGQEPPAGKAQDLGRFQSGDDQHPITDGDPAAGDGVAPREHPIGQVVERERPRRIVGAVEPGTDKACHFGPGVPSNFFSSDPQQSM